MKEGDESITQPNAPPALEWTVHLAKRDPRRTAVAVGVIAAGAMAAWVGFGSFLLGLLAAVLLVGAVSDYLLPVRYHLGGDGIAAHGIVYRRRMDWRLVRRVLRDRLGVKLSPLPRPSRLEAYRGIYLWFSGDNESVVMQVIAHYTSTEAAGADDRPPVQFPARTS